MRKFFIVLIIVWSLLPTEKILAQSVAGFVPGNIWYSKDPFEEGDKIQIYTMLFNPDSREFSGTVIFFDNSTFLGKKDFKLNSKEANDFFINWTATVGDHKIYAKIENAKFLLSTGKYEDYYTAGNQTGISERSVSKKITTNSSNSNKSLIDTSSITIPDFGKIIEDKTPDVIAKPVVATASGVDSLRSNIGNSIEKTKAEVKQELNPKTEEKKKTPDNKIMKPFKYVELFFLYLFSFIFNNKFIFYPLCLIIIFFILRFIWRKIF